MLVAGPSSHVYQSCISSRPMPLMTTNGNRELLNSSVITISSTSSPSHCGSSLSNSFSLIKSVAASISRGTEIIKQKVSEKIFTKGKPPDVSSNFSNSPFLVYPTKTHRSYSQCSNESNDSLVHEIRHFKPIKIAPLTSTNASRPSILMVPSIQAKPKTPITHLASPLKSSTSVIDLRLSKRLSAFKTIDKRKCRKSQRQSKAKLEKSVEMSWKQRQTQSEKTVQEQKNKTRSSRNASKRGRVQMQEEEEEETNEQCHEALDKRKKQEKKDFEFAKKLQRQLDHAARVSMNPYLLRETRSRTTELGLSNQSNTIQKSRRRSSRLNTSENSEPIKRFYNTRQSSKRACC